MKNRTLLRLGIALSIGTNVVLVVLVALLMTRRDPAEAGGSSAAAAVPAADAAVGAPSAAAATQPPATAVPSPTALPSPAPSETAMPTLAAPTLAAPTEPPPTEPPPPTATPLPTETAVPPTPSPTPEPPEEAAARLTGPEWLQYLNQLRLQAGLPLVVENGAWSQDSIAHSMYMVNTGQLWHDEDINSPFFSLGGQAAAQNGNIAATIIEMTSYEWAFNYWTSAPFHAVPMLDPELLAVGYGDYRDVKGSPQVAATLDVKRGLGELPAGVQYPILFPKDGGQAWVLRYSLPEFPFALTVCSGYQQPSGAPIIVQIGSGEQVPNVTRTSVTRDGQPIQHCVFDETTYFNSNARQQDAGRRILDERDAIILMPRQPLEVGFRYDVVVEVNGETIAWSFETVRPPGS